MKVWRKYARYLLAGEWHIHTSYTDGRHTVFEYCTKALEQGIPLLAFTEHVRKKLEFNFDEFLRDIEKARKKFNLIILSGCEAKVLPGGELDVDDQILKEVDYPIFAFHAFPNDSRLYLDSLQAVLKNKLLNAWAHPGSCYGGSWELPEEALSQIFELMKEKDVLLEINKKHHAPPASWFPLAAACNINKVRGSDIHCLDDLT